MTAVAILRANIEQRLDVLKISLREAERRAGLGTATLSRFVAGTTDAMSIEVAEKLAPALETTLADLMGASGAAAPATLQLLHPDQLFASPLNPRKTTALDKGAIGDLARSLAEKGVLQNLIARPHPTIAEAFEIVAGERRWRAACLGQKEGILAADFVLPVAVRPLTDDELVEIALVENIDRADMSPLETADGIAFLHASAREKGEEKAFTKRLAEATGRSDRWVRQQVQLARDLTVAAREQLAAGNISLEMAKELSQVPAAAQAHALPKILARTHSYSSAENLQLALTQDLPKAEDAIFDLAEYDGGFVVRDKIKHFADAKQAERLQKAAIKVKADAFAATRAFVETYTGWNLDTAFPPAPKSLKGKAGDTKAPWGVVIARDRFKVAFHDRRLKRTETETATAPQAQPSATLIQKRDAARSPIRAKLAEQLALLFEARPVDAARALILSAIDSDGTLLAGDEPFDQATTGKALSILGVKLPDEPEDYRDNDEVKLAWEREALDAIVAGLKAAGERTLFRCIALLVQPARERWTMEEPLTPTDVALMKLLDAEIPPPLQHELDGGDILDVASPPADEPEAEEQVDDEEDPGEDDQPEDDEEAEA